MNRLVHKRQEIVEESDLLGSAMCCTWRPKVQSGSLSRTDDGNIGTEGFFPS